MSLFDSLLTIEAENTALRSAVSAGESRAAELSQQLADLRAEYDASRMAPAACSGGWLVSGPGWGLVCHGAALVAEVYPCHGSHPVLWAWCVRDKATRRILTLSMNQGESVMKARSEAREALNRLSGGRS